LSLLEGTGSGQLEEYVQSPSSADGPRFYRLIQR
jgi:hypothetical protein